MPQEMPTIAEIEDAKKFFRDIVVESPFIAVARKSATLLNYIEWLERDCPSNGDQFDGSHG